ncbi:MAG TPA: hypothetical protein ENN30_01460 [Candidatus Woesearchaeota archaeon]|nr:hypothetical protein [Candidatus Woesearchaeota archaeon]
MKKIPILALVMLVLVLSCAHASEFLIGGNVRINEPLNENLFVAGGTVKIFTPINGSLFAAGGEVFVNSTVENAVITGGQIKLGPGALIKKDATLIGSIVENHGTIVGNLSLNADHFTNNGSIGVINIIEKVEKTPQQTTYEDLMSYGLRTLGTLLLGVVLVIAFPKSLAKLEKEIKTETIKKTAIGFGVLLLSISVVIMIIITIVGIPFGVLLAAGIVLLFFLSPLIVALVLGDKIVKYFNIKTNKILVFTIGFLVIRVLLKIPRVGIVLSILMGSLGFGAIFSTVKNWKNKKH